MASENACCASKVNFATFSHVWACAAISSGSPASQSRASFNGLTCSISHDTPHATSEPSGSIAIPTISNARPTVPRVPSTQLSFLIPLEIWAASSTKPKPVYHVVDDCACATSGLPTHTSPVDAPRLRTGCRRPQDGSTDLWTTSSLMPSETYRRHLGG